MPTPDLSNAMLVASALSLLAFGLQKISPDQLHWLSSAWFKVLVPLASAALTATAHVLQVSGFDWRAVAYGVMAALMAALAQATSTRSDGAVLRARKLSMLASRKPQGGFCRADLLIVLPILGCLGIVTVHSACGPTAKAIEVDVTKCAAGQLPAAINSLMPDVTAAIMGTTTAWDSELAALETQGVNVAVCAISAAIGELGKVRGEMTPQAVTAVQRGRAYLAKHGIK